MTTQSYDALIVGARPAGAATAMLLARAGARVLVVDRCEPGTDTMSTHALTRAGATQLARWGLFRRLREAGTPAIRRTTLHYGSEEVPLDIRSDEDIDGLITPRRTVLDPVIAGAALEAGAELRYSTPFRELLHDSSGRVRGAVVVGPDGQPCEVTAGIVVGADGRRSTVARRLGAGEIKRSNHVAAHVYSYLAGVSDTGTHLYFRDGIGLGVMPTNDNLHCAVVSMPPQRYLAERRAATSPEGFLALLAEAAPDAGLARAELVQRPVGFAGEHGYIRRSHGPGWALVGDASYFKDPVTAHGITDALRDAQILSDAILKGTDAALASYQAVRDSISAELFAVTDEIAAFDWSLDEIKGIHLRLNSALKREQAWMAAAFDHRTAVA